MTTMRLVRLTDRAYLVVDADGQRLGAIVYYENPAGETGWMVFDQLRPVVYPTKWQAAGALVASEGGP